MRGRGAASSARGGLRRRAAAPAIPISGPGAVRPRLGVAQQVLGAHDDEGLPELAVDLGARGNGAGPGGAMRKELKGGRRAERRWALLGAGAALRGPASAKPATRHPNPQPPGGPTWRRSTWK
jgi:hypothetical protein